MTFDFGSVFPRATPRRGPSSAARRRPPAARSARGSIPTARGPNGELLYLDTARFGPPDAANMLVLIAGTHGVEGHCGSGARDRLAAQRRARQAAQGHRRAADPRHQSATASPGRAASPRTTSTSTATSSITTRPIRRTRAISRWPTPSCPRNGTTPARPRPSGCSRATPRTTAPSACRARSPAASTPMPTASSSAATSRPGATAPSAPSPAPSSARRGGSRSSTSIPGSARSAMAS